MMIRDKQDRIYSPACKEHAIRHVRLLELTLNVLIFMKIRSELYCLLTGMYQNCKGNPWEEVIHINKIRTVSFL